MCLLITRKITTYELWFGVFRKSYQVENDMDQECSMQHQISIKIQVNPVWCFGYDASVT